jgi:hypothetical protein
MRSPLIAAYLLAVCLPNLGMPAPAVRPQCQSHDEVAPQRMPSAVVHRSSGPQSHSTSAIDTHRRQTGNQQSDNRQLPGPVGLLLALGLVDGGSTTLHQTRTELH